MIYITARKNLNSYVLQADGHAGADEYGRDIVCAAVTILLDTLCELWNYKETDDSWKERWLLRPIIEKESGHIYLEAISSSDLSDHQNMGTWVFVVYGLQRLAEKYPQYISLTT